MAVVGTDSIPPYSYIASWTARLPYDPLLSIRLPSCVHHLSHYGVLSFILLFLSFVLSFFRSRPPVTLIMHFLSLAVIGSLAAGGLAAPTQATHVVHESRHELPSTWVKRSAHEADALLPVRIGLTQGNLDRGYDLLMEV